MMQNHQGFGTLELVHKKRKPSGVQIIIAIPTQLEKEDPRKRRKKEAKSTI